MWSLGTAWELEFKVAVLLCGEDVAVHFPGGGGLQVFQGDGELRGVPYAVT